MKLQSKGRQLAELIREKIESGSYSANSKIPSQRTLCNLYSVSRETVLAAQDILKKDGLLTGARGSGMWVTCPANGKKNRDLLRIHIIIDYSFFYNHLFVNLFKIFFQHYQDMVDADIIFTYGLDGFKTDMSRDDIFLLCGKFKSEKLNDFKTFYPRTILVHWEHPDFNYVVPDEEKAGRLAAKEFVDNGHTKIGIIHCSGSMSEAYLRQEFTARIFGFTDYLAERDITPAINFRDSAWDWQESANKLIDVFFRQSIKVSAILCPFDQIAVNLYQALSEENIRVPEDISLISFDNNYYTQFFPVALTEIALPLSRYAELLFEGVTELSRGNAYCRKISPYIVKRKSVAQLD